ncbi:MAG: hypothetical protein IJ794_05495 [Lachnospiraceae bacterium]|nr:hypothetical protein [Lachnospiraceae bacterium]
MTEKQLAALKEIQSQLSEENEILEREIKLVETGIYGEIQEETFMVVPCFLNVRELLIYSFPRMK